MLKSVVSNRLILRCRLLLLMLPLLVSCFRPSPPLEEDPGTEYPVDSSETSGGDGVDSAHPVVKKRFAGGNTTSTASKASTTSTPEGVDTSATSATSALPTATPSATPTATATATPTVTPTAMATPAPASAPVLSGTASVTSNVTNFILDGTCTAGYTLNLSGDVSASNVASPAQSLTQVCLANGMFSFTIAKTADGQYVFQVSQTNPLNSVESPSVSKIWTRDTFPPNAILIVVPVDNPTTSRSGTFSISGVCEANAMVNMTATVVPNSLTVAPVNTTCSGSGSFSTSQYLGPDTDSPTDGTYTYSFSQTDAAGNTSQSTAFVWVKTSSVPATPVISNPTRNSSGIYYTNSSTSSTFPNISVSCTGSNDVTISENGVDLITGPCVTSNYSYQVTSRVDGTYVYSIYQTETTNGTSSAVATFMWIRDTSAPALPVFTNPNTSSITSPYSLSLTGTCETNATVTLLVGGVTDSSTTCIAETFTATVSRSVAGTYAITAKQSDPAGNASLSTSAISWTQDPNAIPIPTVTFPVGASITNNAAMLNIVGLCQAGFYISLSNGTNTTLSSSEISNPAGLFVQNCAADGTFSFTVAKSNDGTFNFNITQQIVSGGASSVAVPVSWTRDTIAPTVILTASSANPYSANAYFTFAANEAVTSYLCSSDNVTFTTCTSPYTLALATATHPKVANGIAKTLYVKATDNAKNTSAAASVAWTPTVNFASLLYHFDGNGTNVSSYDTAVSSPITTTGATFTTAQAGFGTNAMSVPANPTTPITLADNAILGSFLSTATIEFMFSTTSPTATNVITHQTSSTSGVSWAIKTAKINSQRYRFSFSGSTNGTTLANVASTCSLRANGTWYHIAIIFNAGSVSFYCNGTSSGTGTVGVAGQARLFDTTAAMNLGGSFAFTIDELRISQGLRYTSSFTQPNSAFTAD